MVSWTGGAMRSDALTERSELWRAELARTFAAMMADQTTDRAPEGALRGSRFGQASVFEISGTAQVVRRTAAAVRAVPAEGWKAYLQMEGEGVLEQGHAQLAVRTGDLVLYDLSRPYAFSVGAFRGLVVSVPRESLGLAGATAVAATGRTWSVREGPGRLLAEYLDGLVRTSPGAGDPSAEPLGDAAVALLAATVGHVPVAAGGDEHQIRSLVLGHVRNRLRDPGLCPASVATSMGMSRRTLDRLFEDDEMGVAARIRHDRLEAVRRDLADPQLAERSIVAVAARWCFFDQAHFSRAFRRAYGTTPSEYRRRAG
jgi:AraC-like DNA-binding protein